MGGEVDAAGLLDGDVGVDLRGGRAGVAEEVLHDAQVGPAVPSFPSFPCRRESRDTG